MSEVNAVPGILEVIKSITANHESGRLEISSPGTHGPGTHASGRHGVLLFTDGKLVDARLESLSGFQAVNAAVALRDVEFSFDHVVPAPHAVSITPSERVVLKQFFGIEAAQMVEEPMSSVEPDPGWNETPEQVVPLTEVEELPQGDLEETPTVEVAAVRSVPIVDDRSFGDGEQLGSARQFGSARKFAFLLRPHFAVGLVLLLGLVVGAVTLRSRFRARQQSASVANAVAAEPGSVADAATPKVEQVASEPVKTQQVTRESPPVAVTRPATTASQPPTNPSRPAITASDRTQDLNGEWRLINTVEKTAYKSFDKMQVGFRLKINQTGKAFTAKGEKFSENGKTLPANSRTPIHVTGSIDGDNVVATFVEDGKMRRTSGRFVWKLQSGDSFTGTFVSTAANTSGRSAVTKEE